MSRVRVKPIVLIFLPRATGAIFSYACTVEMYCIVLVFHVREIGPIQYHWLGSVGVKIKTTIWYIHIWTQLSSGILYIPIFKHKNAFYRKRQIFWRQFLYLNLLFSWQETVENYLHRPENSYLKKKVNQTKVRKVILEYYNLCHDFSNRL